MYVPSENIFRAAKKIHKFKAFLGNGKQKLKKTNSTHTASCKVKLYCLFQSHGALTKTTITVFQRNITINRNLADL